MRNLRAQQTDVTGTGRSEPTVTQATTQAPPQTKCFWPSGRTIKNMNTRTCRKVLRDFGVEGPKIDALTNQQIRSLISQLKKDSHLDGECQCPAAPHVRATLARQEAAPNRR